MDLSGIKSVNTLSGSSFHLKIMQKYQVGKRNISRVPKLIIYKERRHIFLKKIIDKNRKWKKMALSYSILVYNIASRFSQIFRGKINFFLSFHIHNQNQKFLNVLWNFLNQVLIRLNSGIYQSNIETITKEVKNIFLLSILKNQPINFGKRNDTNYVTDFFKSRIRVLDTTFISKKNYIPESLLLESKSLSHISKLKSFRIEDNAICNIEKLSNKISDLNFLSIFKIIPYLSNPEFDGHLKNSKLFKKIYLLKDIILASWTDFISSSSALRVLEVLYNGKLLNNQYLLNESNSLLSNIFSTYIDYRNKQSFSNRLFQLRNMFLSKNYNHVCLQSFTKKLMSMFFSATKKIFELKIVNSRYYHNSPKQLRVNIIKNPFLIFPTKVPEDIPVKIRYKNSISKELSKNLHFLMDNVFLNEQKFIQNLSNSKISKLSTSKSNNSAVNNDSLAVHNDNSYVNNDIAVKNNLYSNYIFNSFSYQHCTLMNNLYTKYFFNNFSNQHNTLDNRFFSTSFNHLGNISFRDNVSQSCNMFLLKASSFIHPKTFSGSSLRVDFSTDKKVTGFKTKNNNHYLSQKPNLSKANRIKNPFLTFIIKSPESLPDQMISELLENRTFLKTQHFSNNIFLNKERLLKSIISLKTLRYLFIQKDLHSKHFFNHFFDQDITLNGINYSTSIDIYRLSKISFNSVLSQLRNTFSLKTYNHVCSQSFTKKLMGTFFSAFKKMVKLKVINSHYYDSSKLLSLNKIKNPVLTFPIKVPENIPTQLRYKNSMSKEFSKNLHFLMNHIFLNKKKFIQNLINSKISKFSAEKNDNRAVKNNNSEINNDLAVKNNSTIKNNLAIKNELYSNYLFNSFSYQCCTLKNDLYTKYLFNNFSNQRNTLNSNFFPTGIYCPNNICFGNTVHQPSNTFLSKVPTQVSLKIFSEKSLKMNFLVAKKMTECKVKGNGRYLTQRSKKLTGLRSESANLKFENRIVFPFNLPNLSLENLIFPGRNTQFSFSISQRPVIVKNSLILSLTDLEVVFKRIFPVSMKKDLSAFAAGNKISGLERTDNHNFRINTENLVFRTQLDMEPGIEEKIEQKIIQKIEQIKKASIDIKEASVKQYLSDNSAIREFQKQFLDINYISDQVFRIMEHKLITERERRGIL